MFRYTFSSPISVTCFDGEDRFPAGMSRGLAIEVNKFLSVLAPDISNYDRVEKMTLSIKEFANNEFRLGVELETSHPLSLEPNKPEIVLIDEYYRTVLDSKFNENPVSYRENLFYITAYHENEPIELDSITMVPNE